MSPLKRAGIPRRGGREMAQAVNPYLPSYEYVPDGEPHVVDGRVYVYGSHDRFGAPMFCVNDYVCWSAPVDDLSDWRYEGVIYRKKQDPLNRHGFRSLYAPDMAQGTDGRFYLYYAFDFMGVMGVAVCDTPAGQYEFYGHIHFPDGRLWGSRSGDEFPFDPGVLVDDDGRVYLYSGFQTKVPFISSRFRDLKNTGCVVMELDKDMTTIRKGPTLMLPCKGKGDVGDFAGHEFFEASSIRKIDGKYVFVYSSRHNHELCYAVSDRPDGGYRFGGTLVDIGDVFLDGRDETHALNYLGNTHGGILNIGEDFYIFYHRQTNRSSYARQACAEKLTRTPDGGFMQAEVTSCGLNGGPLRGEGLYEARIACNLWSRDGAGRIDGFMPKRRLRKHPYFTQNGKDDDHASVQYIANMRDGAVAGFKYFQLEKLAGIEISVGGSCDGAVEVSDTPRFETVAARLAVEAHGERVTKCAPISLADGMRPLYFRFKGKGAMDFYSFRLNRA